MEVLVAGHAEKRSIRLGRILHADEWHSLPLADQCRRVAVLQPAVTVAERQRQKRVSRKRCAAAARLEKLDLGLAYAREVGGQPLHVETGNAAGHDDLVRHAENIEAPE